MNEYAVEIKKFEQEIYEAVAAFNIDTANAKVAEMVAFEAAATSYKNNRSYLRAPFEFRSVRNVVKTEECWGEVKKYSTFVMEFSCKALYPGRKRQVATFHRVVYKKEM